MIIGIITYLALGALLATCTRMEGGIRGSYNPQDLVLFMLFWPFIVVWMVLNVKTLSRGGKVVWRKR